MRIVADQQVACVEEAFAPLGEVRTVSGRTLAEHGKEADVWIVRSVTPVNAQALGGSAVRFVGSATAGIDHIDTAYLSRAGIELASAPGSNAESVAQYVAAVLCHFRRVLGWSFRGRTIGIVGAGQCGSRVERIARALDLEPVLCDPPLARATGDARYRPLRELTDCDIISVHVPLLIDGPDRTVGLVGEDFLACWKPGGALINAARGTVVDERALRGAIEWRRVAAVALDVWEGEPGIDVDLLAQVTIATPHIAGYSYDGKLRATAMVHEALCRWLGRPPLWTDEPLRARPERTVRVETRGQDSEDLVARLVLDSHPLRRDDAALRALASLAESARPAHFDALRRDYPIRREFAATHVVLDPFDPALGERLRQVGFSVRQEAATRCL